MSETPERKKRNLALTLAPVFVFAAIVALFAYALNSGDPSRLPSALIGKPAPNMAFAPLQALTGDDNPLPGIEAAGLKNGHVTVLNFWASWCGPCISEHPQIVTLSKRSDVKIYGINYKDKPADAHRYLNKYGNPYTALGVDSNGRSAIEWGVAGVPETFVISPSGKITYKFIGPITPDILKTKILPAIKAAQLAK